MKKPFTLNASFSGNNIFNYPLFIYLIKNDGSFMHEQVPAIGYNHYELQSQYHGIVI